MINIRFILLVIAAILFLLAALNIVDSPRINLTAAGLFCWVVSALV